MRTSKKLPPASIEQERHLDYWRRLNAIHNGYTKAAERIIQTIGVPICIPYCGHCCENNSVLAFGLEAEYAASYLLGKPHLINTVLDSCREWLTRTGDYTYGRQLTVELWNEKASEWERILQEPCPFLTTDKKCLIHQARPLVCRAYGVTHMPGPDCPRPLGRGEDENSRAWFDAKNNHEIPLYNMVIELRNNIIEPRYSRQGFFTTMLFERFRANELAGLIDDGKIPLLKLSVGWGGDSNLMLWQEQLDKQWRAEAADKSIAEQIPLRQREHEGKPPIVSLNWRQLKQ